MVFGVLYLFQLAAIEPIFGEHCFLSVLDNCMSNGSGTGIGHLSVCDPKLWEGLLGYGNTRGIC